MKDKISEKINEILYDNLMRNYPDYVLILDLDGRIIEVSDNFFILFCEENAEFFKGKKLID